MFTLAVVRMVSHLKWNGKKKVHTQTQNRIGHGHDDCEMETNVEYHIMYARALD